MTGRVVSIALLTMAGASLLWSETPAMLPVPVAADSQLSSCFAVSAGMGVEYISAPDVIDFVNATDATYGSNQRISEFKSAVQFFGSIAYPLSGEWVLKAEYVYLFASYNADIPGLSLTLNVHMPSLILQYVLLDEGVYNLKLGAGLGYHVASLKNEYFSSTNTLTGRGLGALVELEANTPFGDHLFGYLGGDIRGEFIGKMSSGSGSQIVFPTMHAFSIGARLGVSYYF